jgi:hypothetical protein
LVDATVTIPHSRHWPQIQSPLSIDPISRMIQQLPDHCARWSISPLIFVDLIWTIPLALSLPLSLALAAADTINAVD